MREAGTRWLAVLSVLLIIVGAVMVPAKQVSALPQWDYYRTIAIDNTLVPSTQTNFPVLIHVPAGWGISQTDGEPLPAADHTPPQPPPLAEVAAALGSSVDYQARRRTNAEGATTLDGAKIRLHTHDPATFLHELAHAIYARSSDVEPGQDPDQETIAELRACTLAAIYDLDYTGNAWQYISAYNSDPLRAIAATTDDVARIVQFITTLHGA